MTNFYMKMKLGDGTSIPASKLQYGTDVSKYEKNAVGTLYLLANTMLLMILNLLLYMLLEPRYQ